MAERTPLGQKNMGWTTGCGIILAIFPAASIVVYLLVIAHGRIKGENPALMALWRLANNLGDSSEDHPALAACVMAVCFLLCVAGVSIVVRDVKRNRRAAHSKALPTPQVEQSSANAAASLEKKKATFRRVLLGRLIMLVLAAGIVFGVKSGFFSGHKSVVNQHKSAINQVEPLEEFKAVFEATLANGEPLRVDWCIENGVIRVEKPEKVELYGSNRLGDYKVEIPLGPCFHLTARNSGLDRTAGLVLCVAILDSKGNKRYEDKAAYGDTIAIEHWPEDVANRLRPKSAGGPYMAELKAEGTSGIPVPVVTCFFEGSPLKIRTESGVTLYNAEELFQLGHPDVSIPLGMSFEITAQNVAPGVTLIITILDKTGKAVHEEKAGRYEVITVSHGSKGGEKW